MAHFCWPSLRKEEGYKNFKEMFAILFLVLFVRGDDPELPGAILLNVGFDFRNGTVQDFVTEAKALPIFTYSYDQGNTFYDPTHPSTVWKVPDDVYVLSKPSSFYNSFSGESWSFSFVQKTCITSWYIGGGFGYDGFGINANYSSEIGTLHAWCQFDLYDIFMSNILYIIYYAEPTSYLFMTLSDMFQAFVDHMPRQIKTETDKKIVIEFIEKYGTHFAEEGYFGGKFHFDSHLTEKYVNSTTEKFCAKQFSLNFYYQTWDLTLGGGFFQNKSSIHINQKFLKDAVSEFFFEGGDLKYQSNKTLKQWRESLYTLQTMTNGTLTPLWNLFTDPQKEAVVKAAIIQYIKTGKPFSSSIDHASYSLACGIDHTTMNSQRPIFAANNQHKKIEFEEEEEDVLVIQSYDTLSDYLEQFKSYRLMNPGGKYSPVHTSDMYDFYRKTFPSNNKKKKLTTCERTVELFSLEYEDPNQAFLSSDFQRALAALPTLYDRKEYFSFINGFGTTYVKKVILGGKFMMDVWVEEDVVVTEEEVELICRYMLGEEEILVNEDFLENLDVDVRVWGGYDDKIQNWEEFLENVKENPAPLKYEIAGIEEMVQDSLKSELISIAVTEYEDLAKEKREKALDQF